MVFLLEHATLLLVCPVFKADLLICASESNRKKWDRMTVCTVYISDHTEGLNKGKPFLNRIRV